MSAIRAVLVFVVLFTTVGAAWAHGGQYRGDIKPRTPGGIVLAPGLKASPRVPKLGPASTGKVGGPGTTGPAGPSGPTSPTTRSGQNGGAGVARPPGSSGGPRPGGTVGQPPTTPGGAGVAAPPPGGPGSQPGDGSGGPATGGGGGVAKPPSRFTPNRGPGDVVGPTTPGRGPGAARPPAPVAGAGPARRPSPSPGRPTTGARAPVALGVASVPRGGIPLSVFLEPGHTSWLHWWEFNKDPFIRLKDAVHRVRVETGSDEFFMGIGGRRLGSVLKPTEAQIVGAVLPALKAVMERTEQRDIISSVLVAMAKGGRNHPDFQVLPLMASRLTSGDQEIRETAALAMGISQMPESVDAYLLPLVEDGVAGRNLVGRGEVDYRTRSFAAYGLGLTAWATADVDLKYRVFDALNKVLEDDRIISRDVRIAAINAIGLLAPNPQAGGAKDQKLLADCLKALETYYLRRLGAGEQLIQAHVPPALAKLLRGGPEDVVEHFRELFLSELQDRGPVRRSSNDIYRSAALALGELCAPHNGSRRDPNFKYSQVLLETYSKSSDKQTRYFCLIALAQIGGEANRDALLNALHHGQKALEKPWAALALGIYEHERTEAARRAGGSMDPDRLVGKTLRRELLLNKNPETVAAMAIGLGLSRYLDAADDIRDLLQKYRYRDMLAGYLCVSLALMDDQESKGQIHAIVASSVRRPDLLRQSAIALGKLGDKSVTDVLQSMLVEGGQNLAKMSAVASALGYIGDRRTIDPLLDMLFDESLTDLSRAFAAVALGGVIDKEPLPWNSKIGVNMNYRAMVETLTDGAAGILDIL